MGTITCVGGPWHGKVVPDYGRVIRMHRQKEAMRLEYPTNYTMLSGEIEMGEYHQDEVCVAIGSLMVTGLFYRWHQLPQQDAPSAAMGLLIGAAMSPTGRSLPPGAHP